MFWDSIYFFNCIPTVSGRTSSPPNKKFNKGLFFINKCQFNSLFVLLANIIDNTPGVSNPNNDEKAFHSMVSLIKALSSRLNIPVIEFEIACCWFWGKSENIGNTDLLTLQSGSFLPKASFKAFSKKVSGPFSKRFAASARSLFIFSSCLSTNSCPKDRSEKAEALSWSHRSFCSFVKQILVSTG